MNAVALAAFRARAREENEAAFPAMIRIAGGAPLAATTAGLKRGGKLEEGGPRLDDDIVFRVRKGLIEGDSDLLLGKQVFWVEGNRTFRVDSIGTGSATTPFYKLGCNDLAQ